MTPHRPQPMAHLAGLRKLVAFALCMVIGGILQALGSMDATFVTLSCTMFGMFVGGNYGEHTAKRPAGSTSTSATTVQIAGQPPPPITVAGSVSPGADFQIRSAGARAALDAAGRAGASS